MTKQLGCWTAFLLAGCSGSSAGAPAVQPAKTAAVAVQGFMQAVADSNLDKMAALWGTANGPASRTHQPSDYERRIAIMQAYLRNDSFRVTSDVAETPDRRALQVQLRRQVCTWNVPFVAIKTGDGSWLVNRIDLAAAGTRPVPVKKHAVPTAFPGLSAGTFSLSRCYFSVGQLEQDTGSRFGM